MRPHTVFISIVAAAVGGCATSSAVNPVRDPVMLMVSDGSAISYEQDIRVITANVPGTPVGLWAALNAEYAKLNLPITQRDSAEYALAAQNAQFRGRFGDGPMSRVVDCGLTPFGSPRADAYRVWLTVVSQVQASPSGSILRTSVTAKAQDQVLSLVGVAGWS